MQFKEDVLFLGHLDSDKVHKLLGSAKALTYIPFFEGFGIPVIEAMYCDVPVLTSDLTSLPEVAGDAALMVNPNHVGEIATQMSNLANNPMLRQNLIEKGRIQREKFSWDKTAERFWSSILKAS